MKLKGNYDGSTDYAVGDVVLYTNGIFYQMVRPGKGNCADALYWNPLPSPLQECAQMVMDGMELAAPNLSDEALSLKTETGEYLITVDDSGDTPELLVTEVEEG